MVGWSERDSFFICSVNVQSTNCRKGIINQEHNALKLRLVYAKKQIIVQADIPVSMNNNNPK